MRLWVAWITGIATYVAFVVGIDELSKELAVPVSFESFDDEGGHFSTFGLAANIVAIMIASRVGMAINAKSLRGNLRAEGEIDFMAWLLGLIAYGTWGTVVYFAARGFRPSFIFFALDALGGAGIAWAMYTWRNQRVARLKPDNAI